MRIMLTNDDGICAPGMEALVQELHKDHTLLVSAPDRQRSPTSRCLTCYGTLYAQPHIYDFAPEVEAYAVSGTPADSARLGESNLFRDIDILLSGINDGGNLGTDVLYSGTCGAAQEGALQGMNALALSLQWDKKRPAILRPLPGWVGMHWLMPLRIRCLSVCFTTSTCLIFLLKRFGDLSTVPWGWCCIPKDMTSCRRKKADGRLLW